MLATTDGPSAGEPGGRRQRARVSRTIVLLGTDGVGKTTAAAALTAAEHKAGQPALVLRNRSCRHWLLRTAHRFGRELPAVRADRASSGRR